MTVLRDAASTLRPPAGDRHGPLVPMLVALTFVTGVVDAVSYLGFALAGASGLSAAASLAALGSFLAGALAGGRLGATSPNHRGRMLRGAGAAQAALIALALIVALTASDPLQGGVRYAPLVPLALAMGIQNATAQRLAVPELTTTVLTRTLTGLASEAGLEAVRARKRGGEWSRWRRCSWVAWRGSARAGRLGGGSLSRGRHDRARDHRIRP